LSDPHDVRKKDFLNISVTIMPIRIVSLYIIQKGFQCAVASCTKAFTTKT